MIIKCYAPNNHLFFWSVGKHDVKWIYILPACTNVLSILVSWLVASYHNNLASLCPVIFAIRDKNVNKNIKTFKTATTRTSRTTIIYDHNKQAVLTDGVKFARKSDNQLLKF